MGTHFHTWRLVEKGPRAESFYVRPDGAYAVGSGGIDLSEHDDSITDPQQTANLEVLERLRFYAFIGCNDQKHGVNSARARQHIFDKTFMAGNIDDGKPDSGRECHVGETQINRYAAFLFFGQA